jgi:anti-sigma B factor antagonist
MNTLALTTTTQTDPVLVTILHVGGRLDANTEASLREYADQLFEGGARRLVIDLAEVDYISSAGLRALFLIYKQFTPADEVSSRQPEDEMYKSPYIKLANATPEVYGVLNLAGFLHNIPFFPTLKEALDSFK